MVDAQHFDELVRADPLPADPLLLGGEQRFADLIGVVRVQQLALLLFEPNKLQLSLGHFLSRQDRGRFNLAPERRSDALTLLLAHFPGDVVLLNCDLHGLYAV